MVSFVSPPKAGEATHTRSWQCGGIFTSPLLSGGPNGGFLLWARTLGTAEELRQALLEFKLTHKEFWIIERHDYRTLALVRGARLYSFLQAV
jgi:hypothetical protein